MDLQVIQKILEQQLFLVDIQCQQFGHFITKKTNILYIVEKIVLKDFVTL